MALTVRHSRGEYPVQFRSLGQAEWPDSAIVITDENVARHYAEGFASHEVIILRAGEETKSLEIFAHLQSELARRGANRRTPIVALGGGVIGDLVGFVAATYMRGVPLLMAPTSLLAMVDSSVGGKVGVDLPEGKNLTGAFWPPRQVVIDTATLTTLPQDEFANGMAEVIKYGAIMDADLLDTLREPLSPTDPRLQVVIETCVRHKASVVAEDEFETTGRRAILNFGHTVGHAVEKWGQYKAFKHGQAVSIGMVAEARIGEHLGITPQGTAEDLEGILRAYHLPTEMPDANPETLLQAMQRDKKATGNGLAFSLLTARGECKLVDAVSERDVRAALAWS